MSKCDVMIVIEHLCFSNNKKTEKIRKQLDKLENKFEKVVWQRCVNSFYNENKVNKK